MPVIDTNETVDKSMPPEVVAALFQLLRNCGVPVDDRITWLYAQRALYRQMKAAYDQQRREAANQ